MRRLVFMLMLAMISGSAFAQDGADISYDMFGVPEQTIKVLKPAVEETSAAAPMFPDCNDHQLLSGVRASLESGEERLDGENTVAYRGRRLALKNIDNFHEQSVAEFNPDDNRDLATLLVTTKINRGLTDTDFKICAGDNPALHRRVFLLLSSQDDAVRVQIVNFRSGKYPSFVLKK